jgi:hypothetical protein
MKNIDLNKTKIKSGFKAPDGYFEEFENRILKEIPVKETKVVSMFHRKQLWISGVAAILLLAIAIPSYLNSIRMTTAIDGSNIENYLSYQSNITNFDIIENLTNDDIKELESSLAINSDDVEAYLLETQNLDYYLNE